MVGDKSDKTTITKYILATFFVPAKAEVLAGLRQRLINIFLTFYTHCCFLIFLPQKELCVRSSDPQIVFNVPRIKNEQRRCSTNIFTAFLTPSGINGKKVQ